MTLILVAAAVLLLCVIACSSALKIVRYSLESDKIDAPVRLALITDLHSCRYGDGQSDLIGAVVEQAPDLVLFSGDIIDDKMPMDNAFAVLSALAEKYPCYYVSGNHEYWCDEGIDTIKQLIRDVGVTVLEGDCAVAVVNGQRLNICGVDDPTKIGGMKISEQLADARSSADASLFTVLLSHRPEHVDKYESVGFDLTLCGHAHGGQWRIPLILNGLYAPNQGLFPKYAGGKYELDTGVMIVSRGLARESTKLPRIFNRPELVIIDVT